jgi:hypothetical protein
MALFGSTMAAALSSCIYRKCPRVGACGTNVTADSNVRTGKVVDVVSIFAIANLVAKEIEFIRQNP